MKVFKVKQSELKRITLLLIGNAGNTINAKLAAIEFNFKGLLRKIKEEVLWLKFYWKYSSKLIVYLQSLASGSRNF